MNSVSEENQMQSAFAYPFMLFLVVLSFFFMGLMVDYYSTFTIKETIDREFKNIAVNEMGKKLTDEYSSDYISKFDDMAKTNLEKSIKKEFIEYMKIEKNYNITVTKLDIKNPSDKTITCKFAGTFEFKPMIGKNMLKFDLPVEARAKVIRFD